MASALWLGGSLADTPLLRQLLSLPVQVTLFPGKTPPKGDFPVGKQLFPLGSSAEAALREALTGRDIYFLAVQDFTPVLRCLPSHHGRLVALGQCPPPQGFLYLPTPVEKLWETLCKQLPPFEPNTFYISGDTVRCSIADEEFSPLLERMGKP